MALGITLSQLFSKRPAAAAKLEGKCAAERKGRITAEIAHRAYVKSNPPIPPIDPHNLTLLPVGYVSSPFGKRTGCPRQPCLCPSAHGSITLTPNVSPESLVGLEEFNYVWVIFTFHANTDVPKQKAAKGTQQQRNHPFASAKSKILPPRCETKRGIFATRTPHRYNNVGLSLLKVHEVKGRTITVEGIDLCDGTPVYDIKPFIPWDVPGYTEGGFHGFKVNVRCPAWVYDDLAVSHYKTLPYEVYNDFVDTKGVVWSEEAVADLEFLYKRKCFARIYPATGVGGVALGLIKRAVSEVLKQDPRNKKSKENKVVEYTVVFCEATVLFEVLDEGTINVKRLERAVWEEGDADGVKLLKNR